MRRVLAVTLIMSGTIFSIFIFNLVMYAFVPSYRSMLSGAVGRDENIPVVDVNSGLAIDSTSYQEENDILPVSSSQEAEAVVDMGISEDVPLAPSVESAVSEVPAKQIIGKEYHEDCGTGAGYWVITYDDGSTEIEQY
ncbi:hypothetical protein D6855_04765 [Butyrivibrio sp. CB08]|uniref:hypothetical protein n=1 Tax=Butyrivibrio sp. CB08 TaxID=2364879 RepID=UPI000EA8AF05|nr:hypothetical protein [Butyrivibrio sp. CB08]RKM61208.1 hypothetical protein D6855_04765 [Butyrivibrio sp. CB08]